LAVRCLQIVWQYNPQHCPSAAFLLMKLSNVLEVLSVLAWSASLQNAHFHSACSVLRSKFLARRPTLWSIASVANSSDRFCAVVCEASAQRQLSVTTSLLWSPGVTRPTMRHEAVVNLPGSSTAAAC